METDELPALKTRQSSQMNFCSLLRTYEVEVELL